MYYSRSTESGEHRRAPIECEINRIPVVIERQLKRYAIKFAGKFSSVAFSDAFLDLDSSFNRSIFRLNSSLGEERI